MDIAVFSFLGVILGALLQYLFTRHLERQRHQREIRTKAYIDYLGCVAEHANMQKGRQSPEGKELATRTADAKCRIGLYGSWELIEAFAAFERLGATMNTAEQCEAFTRMVTIMRSDSGNEVGAHLQDLEVVLLGTK